MNPSASETPLSLTWSAITHTGKVRSNNEDSFLGLALDAEGVAYLGKEGQGNFGLRDYVFAVSDGMGGARAGEFASRITVEKVTRLLPRGFRAAAAGQEVGFTDLYQELFGEIHRALDYLGSQYEECRGMGATLSLAWFSPRRMRFSHLGDSRIYFLPAEGGIQQITHDHTHIGWQRRNDKITEREARSHPGKNSLQKALGAGHQFIEPQTGALDWKAGDLFLLCTDGLIDGLWDRQIERLLREPDEQERLLPPALRLQQRALDNSGRDNITALVIEATAG
ncbi:MAG: protein phosphatase 2C domain-containing protein [Candidatus Methylacidiphilales bacterium]|nr:protein phosphatase 2C domain-containing protein [Candidatus Methylacidiphilales bacterium]